MYLLQHLSSQSSETWQEISLESSLQVYWSGNEKFSNLNFWGIFEAERNTDIHDIEIFAKHRYLPGFRKEFHFK